MLGARQTRSRGRMTPSPRSASRRGHRRLRSRPRPVRLRPSGPRRRPCSSRPSGPGRSRPGASGDVRRVPGRPARRPRRHGRGLPGARRGPRPPRGRQGHQRHRPRPRRQGSLHAGGARRRSAPAPQRAHGLPGRRARGSTVPDHRVHPRADPRRGQAPPALEARAPARRRPLAGARRGAPARRAPPGHQAGQRHPDRRRRGQAPRLRPRQVPRRQRAALHLALALQPPRRAARTPRAFCARPEQHAREHAGIDPRRRGRRAGRPPRTRATPSPTPAR